MRRDGTVALRLLVLLQPVARARCTAWSVCLSGLRAVHLLRAYVVRAHRACDLPQSRAISRNLACSGAECIACYCTLAEFACYHATHASKRSSHDVTSPTHMLQSLSIRDARPGARSPRHTTRPHALRATQACHPCGPRCRFACVCMLSTHAASEARQIRSPPCSSRTAHRWATARAAPRAHSPRLLPPLTVPLPAPGPRESCKAVLRREALEHRP